MSGLSHSVAFVGPTLDCPSIDLFIVEIEPHAIWAFFAFSECDGTAKAVEDILNHLLKGSVI
jgi:hypothetical protein